MVRLGWVSGGLGLAFVSGLSMTAIAQVNQPLSVVYPPDGHETTANQIFLIGTAPAGGVVTVNGQTIERSTAGHFAPSFPLQLGDNTFTLRYQDQELTLHVTRQSADPPTPVGVAFGAGSLTPAVNIARLPGEVVCFGAIAPANATVSTRVGNQTIPLLPQPTATDLPPNSAVLTAQNQPTAIASVTNYQGCTTFTQTGVLGQPDFNLTLNGQTIHQTGTGAVEILPPVPAQVIEVTSDSGTARTGPSTDYSRLTPLPKGTRAAVTGREGDWLRLDYGGWMRASETQTIPNLAPPRTLIRSIRATEQDGWTDITFPLQVPVPVSVIQGDRTFTLTLYNTTAQTDTILLNDDRLIERLDWQQIAPGQVQYTFNLKSQQQWGYKLRYEGTSLVLSLRHPPQVQNPQRPLTGIRILLDPGHGGPEDFGARGPTGVPEKDVTLTVSRLLRDELVARGATVYMTREGDADLYPQDRVDMINQIEPTLALSLHYNALPDSGDAIHTAGVGSFWYNAQAHSLAVALHHDLVQQLDRPSYGVFWNNLALTRPTVAPCVLLELGFMINPVEFEWVTNSEDQRKLATALADSLTNWVKAQTSSGDRHI
ncbi:MAG TPA: N-acetylmuramoyl-L-alanine amidase [Crinalium sp.]